MLRFFSCARGTKKIEAHRQGGVLIGILVRKHSMLRISAISVFVVDAPRIRYEYFPV